MIYKLICSVFIHLLVLAGFAPGAFAVTSAWQENEKLSFRILASEAGEDGVIHGAFEIDLAEGWHTYWRTPGDSGLAPSFDLENSGNLRSFKMQWPLPQRFEHFGLYTFGYEDRLLLPFTAKKKDESSDLILNANAKIMVCKVVCVPEKVEAEIEIPAGFQQAAELEAMLRGVRESVPVRADTPGLRIENAVVSKDMLVVTVFAQHGMDGTDLFVETEGLTISAPPEVSLFSGDVRRAHLKIPAPPDVDNFAAALSGKKTVLTLSNRGRAVEKEIVF